MIYKDFGQCIQILLTGSHNKKNGEITNTRRRYQKSSGFASQPNISQPLVLYLSNSFLSDFRALAFWINKKNKLGGGTKNERIRHSYAKFKWQFDKLSDPSRVTSKMLDPLARCCVSLLLFFQIVRLLVCWKRATVETHLNWYKRLSVGK